MYSDRGYVNTDPVVLTDSFHGWPWGGHGMAMVWRYGLAALGKEHGDRLLSSAMARSPGRAGIYSWLSVVK